MRVSTAEQAASGLGIEAQIQALTETAKARSWELILVVEGGKSGKRINGKLQHALDQLANKEADGLVVTKLDRLARSVLHAAEIMTQARRQGWNLIVLDLGMDLATPQGRAMANMMATFAEFERELIGIRTKEAMAAARLRPNAKRQGRKPLVNPAIQARIVQERTTSDPANPAGKPKSFPKIASQLTADGIPSPTGQPVWQESTVRRIYQAAQRKAYEAITRPIS